MYSTRRKRAIDCHSPGLRPAKRRRCDPIEQKASGPSKPSRTGTMCVGAADDHLDMAPQHNPFKEVIDSNASQGKTAHVISDHIKREYVAATAPDDMQIEMHCDSGLRTAALHSSGDGRNTVLDSEKPLFTMSQVQMICDRVLKKREEEICETFDNVLTTKLAEQHDLFVKYTFDQINSRFDKEPSYYS